ncbi:MAG: glycosyltransferase family 2 protein [Limisphaerales bacterium]
MNSKSQERPLVSFLLVAYQQEQFIREALEGAFAQTYSPLEIILSDDCSPDGTFAIMQKMAGAYRGPHQVRARQTSRNLGLSSHLDDVAGIARGQWLVIAAGDDISLPDRVANHLRLVQKHPRACSTFLSPITLGSALSGNTVPKIKPCVLRYPETLKRHGGGALGATHAIKKSCWQVFGDLGNGLTCEDWALAFRSSLIGEVVLDDCPGVRYRLHEQSITSQNFGAHNFVRQLRVECNALKQFSRDLSTAIQAGHVSAESGAAGLLWLSSAIKSNQRILACLEAGTAWDFLKTCARMLTCRDFVVGNYRRRLGVVGSALQRRLAGGKREA